MCVSGGKKCLFFEKSGVFCFLETPILRFALLPYYGQTVLTSPGLWKCLIILHVRQAFEVTNLLNMARLYMQGLYRVPNMSD